MFNLNNKGQSLVMFVMIIPIFMLLITLVYDVGNALYEKNSLFNTCYMVIDYGLDNIESVSEDELINLVMLNTKNLNFMSLDIDEGVIEVNLKKNIRGILGGLFGFDMINVNAHYEGSIVDGEKKIERIG